jgi:hypothetical protein
LKTVVQMSRGGEIVDSAKKGSRKVREAANRAQVSVAAHCQSSVEKSSSDKTIAPAFLKAQSVVARRAGPLEVNMFGPVMEQGLDDGEE